MGYEYIYGKRYEARQASARRSSSQDPKKIDGVKFEIINAYEMRQK